MQIILETTSKTFQYTFSLSLLVFAIVLFAAASYSWTGPTGTAPANNVSAPINVGTASQVKSGALSVNGLSVYGSEYISGTLGVGTGAGSTWRIDARGTYGIYGEATSGQAIRGYAYPGYAGYFVGYGGVYAQNTSGYYAFLGYPGSSWSVYANGPTYTGSYSRADGGFCIGGSCRTSWSAMGGSYWTGWVPVNSTSLYSNSCASGYVMTGNQMGAFYVPGGGGEMNWEGSYESRQRILCTSLAPQWVSKSTVASFTSLMYISSHYGNH